MGSDVHETWYLQSSSSASDPLLIAGSGSAPPSSSDPASAPMWQEASLATIVSLPLQCMLFSPAITGPPAGPRSADASSLAASALGASGLAASLGPPSALAPPV